MRNRIPALLRLHLQSQAPLASFGHALRSLLMYYHQRMLVHPIMPLRAPHALHIDLPTSLNTLINKIHFL